MQCSTSWMPAEAGASPGSAQLAATSQVPYVCRPLEPGTRAKVQAVHSAADGGVFTADQALS